jgi:hypothetical protein
MNQCYACNEMFTIFIYCESLKNEIDRLTFTNAMTGRYLKWIENSFKNF